MLRRINGTMDELREHNRRMRAERATELTKKYLQRTAGVDSNGALMDLLKKRSAHLYLTVLPEGINVTQYAHIEGVHHEDEDRDFLDRKTDCVDRCPEHGGACDKPNSPCSQRPGQEPVYDAKHNSLNYVECAKWPLYGQYKDLAVMGVSTRLRKSGAGWMLFELNKDYPSRAVVLEWCKQYASNFRRTEPPPSGAVFEGAHGTGKTHMAQTILTEIFYQKSLPRICGYIKSTTLLAHELTGREESEGDNGALLYRLERTPLLVLDSFGASPLTTEQRGILQKLMTQRLKAHLPTIVTTSEPIEASVSQCGEELVALVSEDVPRVMFQGKDWRQAHRVVIGA